MYRAVHFHDAQHALRKRYFVFVLQSICSPAAGRDGPRPDQAPSGARFLNLRDARRLIAAWQKDYNEERPGKELGELTPAQHARLLAGTLITVTASHWISALLGKGWRRPKKDLPEPRGRQQRVGIRQVCDSIRPASFVTCDLGCFDIDRERVEPGTDPFVTDKV